jgi:hypothetical protein
MSYRLKQLRSRSRRAGMALMMVVFTVGMAAVMGVAILAASSMQSQVKGNILAGAQADYLAESGVQLGMYYLQNPGNASALNASGVYTGGSSITFGADTPGYVDIAISTVATNTYDITSTAHGGNSLTRTQTARVYVNTQYTQTKALSTNGNWTMPTSMTVDGDIRCDGNLTVAAGGTINGLVRALATTNYPTFSAPETFPVKAAPLLTNIDIYTTTGAATPYYNYVDTDGTTKVGYPQLLPAVVIGEYLPAANNPKNVWYTNNATTFTDFILNGTLVMRGSTRRMGIFGNVQITAMENMPALVLNGPMQFSTDLDPRDVVIDGLCWMAGNITTTGTPATGCSLTINGALLFGSSATGVGANYLGTINVTYDSAKVQVPNFSSVGATPQSVRILRWGNQ